MAEIQKGGDENAKRQSKRLHDNGEKSSKRDSILKSPPKKQSKRGVKVIDNKGKDDKSMTITIVQEKRSSDSSKTEKSEKTKGSEKVEESMTKDTNNRKERVDKSADKSNKSDKVKSKEPETQKKQNHANKSTDKTPNKNEDKTETQKKQNQTNKSKEKTPNKHGDQKTKTESKKDSNTPGTPKFDGNNTPISELDYSFSENEKLEGEATTSSEQNSSAESESNDSRSRSRSISRSERSIMSDSDSHDWNKKRRKKTFKSKRSHSRSGSRKPRSRSYGSETDKRKEKERRNRDRSISKRRGQKRKKLRRKYSDSSSSDEDNYLDEFLKMFRRKVKGKKESKRSKRSKQRRSRSRSRSKSRKHNRYHRSSSESSCDCKEGGESEYRASSTERGNLESIKMGNGSTLNTPEKVAVNEAQKIRSPSDTAVWAPAVAFTGTSPKVRQKYYDRAMNKDKSDNQIENETELFINNFKNNFRLADTSEKHKGKEAAAATPSQHAVRSEVRVPSRDEGRRHRDKEKEDRSRVELAREQAKESVLQAEKYKADLAPEGTCSFSYEQLKNLIDAQRDDEFFHTICHVDPSLREKIKKGEYVDLEKLLVKQKGVKPKFNHRVDIVKSKEGLNKYELVQNEGENRITNVYRWEQAFRVYATIYSKANPIRGPEIWQYIDSIHRAAKTFNWDAVAEYDYCFRQLMGEYPDRSWAKIYQQMWNLTLCEGGQKTNTHHDKRRESHRDKETTVCWKFNKSHCNYGKKCRFEHKCSYCGSYSHPYQSCPKRSRNKSQERSKKKDKKNDEN